MSRKIEVEIVGDSNSLKRALGDATDHTSKFGSTLSHIGKVATEAFAVVGGAAVAGIGLSVKAAIDAEKSQARLEQAFRNVGLSAEEMAPQIEKAEAAGRRLGFTDDDVRNSLGSLVTATGDAGKAMDDLGVAQDIARFKGVGLDDATKMLTMAMTGSQRAAKQLGISVSPVTEAYDTLKATMGKTIDANEKLALAHAKVIDKMSTGQAVIDAVREKVQGQGQAFADTAAGGLAQFHAQLQHVEESIGAPLLSAFGNASGALADFVDKFGAAKGLEAKVHVVVEGLEDAGKKIEEFLFGKTVKIRGIDFGGQETIVTQGIVDKIEAGLAHADWSKVGASIGKALQAAIDKAHEESSAAADKGGQSIGEKLKDGIVFSLSNPGKAGAAAAELAAKIVVEFGAKLSPQIYISRFMLEVFNGLTGGAAGRAVSAAVDLGRRIVEGLGHGIANIADTIHAAAEKVYGALKAAAGEAYSLGAAIGKAIIEGIGSGLDSLAGWAKDKAAGIVHSIFGAAKAAAHIGSPSKLFEDGIGKPIAEGIILGFTEGMTPWADTLTAILNNGITRASAEASPVATGISRQLGEDVNNGITDGIQRTEARVAEQLDAEITRTRVAMLDKFFALGGDFAVAMANGVIASASGLGELFNKVGTAIADACFQSFEREFTQLALGLVDKIGKGAGSGGGLKVPGLAVGGIVTAPTLALIGESGPEAVVPLSPQGVMPAMGGGDTYVFNFPNYLGSKEEVATMIRGQLARNKFRGGL